MTLDFTFFWLKELFPFPSICSHLLPIIFYYLHFFCWLHSRHISCMTTLTSSNSLLCCNCGCAEIGGKCPLITYVDLICESKTRVTLFSCFTTVLLVMECIPWFIRNISPHPWGNWHRSLRGWAGRQVR